MRERSLSPAKRAKSATTFPSPRRSVSPSRRKATSFQGRICEGIKDGLTRHPVPTKACVGAVTACLAHAVLQVGIEGSSAVNLMRMRNFTAATLVIVIATHYWHTLLFTKIAKRSWFSAVCRLLPDQFLFAPLMSCVFLTMMLAANGQNRFPRGQELYQAQLSFWKVWITSQYILFLTLRAPDKIYTANFTGLAWTITLTQAPPCLELAC